MKKRVFYLLVCIFAFAIQSGAFAQSKSAKHAPRLTPEQRIERQTAQIAKTLMLDDATTVKFSAIYKKYLSELQACQRNGRIAVVERTKVGKANMTDEQIEKDIQSRFDQSRKILDIREKYYHEFKKVLKPRQIQKMYSEERANGVKIKKEIEHRNNKKTKK